MSVNTINDALLAFNAINNIIVAETDKIKKMHTDANYTETPSINIDAIQATVFNNVMSKVEGYFAAFEERMNLKLESIKPTPTPPVDLSKVYSITDAITQTINGIENKLNAIEAAAAADEEVTIKEECAPALAPLVTPNPAPLAAPKPLAAPPPAIEESEENIQEEEETQEEPEEEEEAEEELTDFLYKGKTYYMDSEYNVYAQDENGDLIEDPVGTYNQTTRKITFN